MHRLADSARREKARTAFEAERQKNRRPHEVFYFHRVDDPYSALAAQILPRLQAEYTITLKPFIVPPPPANMTPEPDMEAAYNQLDAARIAPFYGLEFPVIDALPSPSAVALANRILAKCTAEDFPAAETSALLWQKDAYALESAAKNKGVAGIGETEELLARNGALRRKMGHYNSAMFFYGGEWYWGIDRLLHLERRLAGLGARKKSAPKDFIATRRTSAPASLALKDGVDKKFMLEYFPSLRSPYTYLSFAETLALPENYPVELVIRPVLPMVMRGMKVPPAKGFYIFFDTKREADVRDLPFGDVLDPVGPPVLRGYSLFPFANQRGKGGVYLHKLIKGAFAENVDIFALGVLRRIVEESGLDWDEARAHLDTDDWQKEMEANRQAMFAAGCWGVPSFCLKGQGGEPDFAVWGQDRLWLVREEIARRLAV